MKRNDLISCLILMMGLLLPSGWTAALEDAPYRIGARDILDITISAGGEVQQTAKTTVSAGGDITIPFLGKIQAAGLTADELEKRISEPLARDYFVNPEVVVKMEGYHNIRYYISGAVQTPGLYEMPGRASLMALITKAGGVLPDRGNVAYVLRNSVSRVREGESVEELMTSAPPLQVNLKQLLDQGDLSKDMLLESGDVVYIPLDKERDVAETHVYVEGEVKTPGIYAYRSGLTVLNACLMAGGFTQYADIRKVKIIRRNGDQQNVKNVDLGDVKSGKSRDVSLRPGDLINVPETWF